MSNTTPVIAFNLSDTGRRHSGKKRTWDVPMLVDAINSPATQERVKNRDMLGYYGHWPRQRLGMDLAEGGIVDGKVIIIQPSHVTTMLRAEKDGTVYHQEEFFDNPPGVAAAGLYKNKAGGFSSAINHALPKIYGFDYVFEPNFTSNRPYTLDSSGEEDPITLDEVNDYESSVRSVADIIVTFDNAQAEMKAEITRLNMLLAAANEAQTGKKFTLDSMRGRKTKFDDAEMAFKSASIKGNREADNSDNKMSEYLAVVGITLG